MCSSSSSSTRMSPCSLTTKDGNKAFSTKTGGQQIDNGGKKKEKNNRRLVVQHNYHDHAKDTPDDWDQKRKKGKGGVTTPFPLMLHKMLDKIEQDGLGSVVSWQPHGRCFVVHKQKEFVEHVMPKYFHQTKYASFQRQLNLYGFSRLSRGADRSGYYHELFLRGKTFLCDRMQRMRVKGTATRAASNPEAEPNFYSMPPVSSSSASVDTTSSRRTFSEGHSMKGDFFVACKEPPIVKDKNFSYEICEENSEYSFLLPPPISDAHNTATTSSSSRIKKERTFFDNYIVKAPVSATKKNSTHQKRRDIYQEAEVDANLKPAATKMPSQQNFNKVIGSPFEQKNTVFLTPPGVPDCATPKYEFEQEVPPFLHEIKVTNHPESSTSDKDLSELPTSGRIETASSTMEESDPDDFPYDLDDLLEKLLNSK